MMNVVMFALSLALLFSIANAQTQASPQLACANVVRALSFLFCLPRPARGSQTHPSNSFRFDRAFRVVRRHTRVRKGNASASLVSMGSTARKQTSV
jgi:hypothetical protein